MPAPMPPSHGGRHRDHGRTTRCSPSTTRTIRSGQLEGRDRIGFGAPCCAQADSRARPLRRRALRTPRPPAEAMRARNPCFLARRRLLGWNVRFIGTSEGESAGVAHGPDRISDVPAVATRGGTAEPLQSREYGTPIGPACGAGRRNHRTGPTCLPADGRAGSQVVPSTPPVDNELPLVRRRETEVIHSWGQCC
jgi:hypothetical protein